MFQKVKKFIASEQKEFGFLFLEIIISIALISVVFVTLLGIGVLVLNASNAIQKETQADSLLKEGFEALRNFRDGTDWTVNGLGTASVGNGNPYHLENNLDKWVLVSGVENAGIFTRQIIFDKVSRDFETKNIQDNYIQSYDDPDTRKATVIITWPDKTMRTVSYFTNWQK